MLETRSIEEWHELLSTRLRPLSVKEFLRTRDIVEVDDYIRSIREMCTALLSLQRMMEMSLSLEDSLQYEMGRPSARQLATNEVTTMHQYAYFLLEKKKHTKMVDRALLRILKFLKDFDFDPVLRAEAATKTILIRGRNDRDRQAVRQARESEKRLEDAMGGFRVECYGTLSEEYLPEHNRCVQMLVNMEFERATAENMIRRPRPGEPEESQPHPELAGIAAIEEFRSTQLPMFSLHKPKKRSGSPKP